MGIRNKLFLTFLGTFVVLIVAASGFYFFAFEQSLRKYIDERQQAQVERLADHLGVLYAQRGSWDFLLSDPRVLGRLYWLAGDRNTDTEPGKRDRRDAPRHLTLLTADRRPLIGPPPTQQFSRLVPIRTDNDLVGWLAYPDQEAIRDKLDRRFQERQLNFAGWMALVGLALSLLVSWLLARHLVAPVTALSAHTRKLREGDYQTRLGSRRRDELGDLIRHVDSLGERLDQGQKARQRWFSDIAHELRTPLSVLQGELEAVVDGVRPLNHETIAALESEVRQLTHLVNDLHDLALADAGNLRYHFTALDLDTLCEDAVDAVRPALGRRRVRLRTDLSPARVNGDPVRLRQLLDNLLQNSLKYTDEGGEVHLTLGRDGDDWRLTLNDSAPGVPDDALPKLFDHLYRVESSRNRQTGGAGLGLAIARRIVEAHGGTMEADHSPLGGLRITVRLPL
ncbi:MAG TPA: two-component sensor histidine kinase [Alcanivorax sp.]|jgi:two-component system, OmpR family, sensor histidine kinase BaeS|nr:two-component sensor histidine kinase [Alcanivorax sp.]MCH2551915.1 ATP-binding protein [Alcanivorax sp.]HBP76030.1 two-component sensor histidine kinase [Alcanivorax sp.]HBS14314.1 two-component sensor histidine kinase [Alcanivorax sp.]|tara:strand:- start:13101 stop:14456 length:1356 start_codon:yes stop_codon:yes gene_type:complete